MRRRAAGTERRGATLLDIDWRFLLPPTLDGSFRRLLLLGADESVAEQARAAGVARGVVLQPTAETADAVVCLRGAGATLEEVATHVARDGVLYYETGRGLGWPFGASADRLRRSARRAGLAKTRLYWVHPQFQEARTYFPLDVPRAVEWHLGSLQIAATLPARIVRRLLRALARRPALLARLVPRVALVAVRGGAHEPGVPSQLPEPLRGRGRTSLVLVHGDERSRVVALPFAADSEVPLAVVKFFRRPRAGGAAEGEQRVLEQIRPNLHPRLRATVPEPLGVVQTTHNAAAVESFLPGEWLHARWASSRQRFGQLLEDLELVVDWLIDFHLATRQEARSWDDRDADACLGQLADYERAFGTTGAESHLFTVARRHARAAIGTSLPIVWQHSDLSSLNMFRDGSSVRVIDWEGATVGPPLDDLLYFATRWLERARRAPRADIDVAFRELFLGPPTGDRAVAAVRSAITRYADALELDDRLFPLLVLQPWLRRAVGRLARNVTPRLSAREPAIGGGMNHQRVGNRYVTYVEVLAESPETLFALPTAGWREP